MPSMEGLPAPIRRRKRMKNEEIIQKLEEALESEDIHADIDLSWPWN